MKAKFRFSLIAMCSMLAAFLWITPLMAATNQAIDPGGGGVSLTNSPNVTVNSAILQIVKQVWDAGGNCLASSTPVGGCLNNPVTVPAGTVVNFLIYVDNSTSVQVTDARIRDVLDDLAAGFNYVAGSLKWNNNTTATGAAINTIYADAAVNALLDPVDADIASALDTGGTAGQVDNITIGAVAGQANAQLNITASRVFALRFQAIKK